MNAYDEFLASKSFSVPQSGFDVSADDISSVLFPFQRDIVRWAVKRGRAAIFAGTGLGKCHGVDTPIIMFDGSVKMVQDVKVGDELMGPDSKPRKVLSTTKGFGDLFRIVPIKGEPFVCNDVHVLSLKCTSDVGQFSKNQIVNIGLDEYLQKNNKFKHIMKLWRTGVDFPSIQHVLVDPYVIGLWLGDGSKHSPSITTSHQDVEVIEYLEKWAIDNGLVIRHEDGRGCVTRHLSVSPENNQWGKPNVLRNAIKECVVNEEKRIPKSYLTNSMENRLKLLAGIVDSDGYTIDNCIEIVTKYQGLAEDIAFLARSCGLGVTRKTVTKGIKETGFSADYEKLIVYGNTHIIPCLVERKKSSVRKQKKDALKTGFSVEYIGKGDYYGFTLDRDHLYLLGDFTVTHNTLQQLEWARQVHEETQGNVLLLAPLAVASQTVREAMNKLGVEVTICQTADDVKPGLNITNYEKLHHFNPNVFEGVVLDESSILKSFAGKVRTQIIDMFKYTPYKLACTATPAPNDYMELGNHAEFLGVMSRTEMLSMFFVHDGGDTSKWRLKGHAKNKFWEWVASWAVMLQKPSDLGYEDGDYILPPLNITDHVVKATNVEDGALFALEAKTLQERQQARRNSIEERVAKCAEMVNATDEPFLVWCDLNKESELLAKMIPDAVEVKGSDSPEHKEKAMLDFAEGNVRVLVTKASIAGFGLNWQHCNNMAFVGLSDSFEQVFQAIRRCYRFGQKKPVNVHMIISELEGAVANNIKRKEKDFEAMAAEMVKYTQKITSANIKSASVDKTEYNPTIEMKIPEWL